jgi:RNA polymerase sigma-70 factor (ECF subfamily)
MTKRSAAPQSQDDDDLSQTHEDVDAVAQTLAGNVGAYDRLIERYQRRAVAVSYRLLGNIDDAMDVCQEAYLRAFRSLATLQEPARFGAWLMRIVSNLSLNYRRGRRLTISLGIDDESGSGPDMGSIPGRPGDNGDRVAGAEMQKAITAAIEALPEPQRLALVMFAIEEMPQKEVAEILECSVEMVKWNVFQARKTLRETLKDYLQE